MRRARAAPAISRVSTRFTPWCTPDAHSTLDNQAISPVLRRHAYWVRVATPALAPTSGLADNDALWLEITPTYLDRVTLYQLSMAGIALVQRRAPGFEGIIGQGRDLFNGHAAARIGKHLHGQVLAKTRLHFSC